MRINPGSCLLVFAVALLLGGCATTRIAPADLARIKSVTVVSNLDQQPVAKVVGTTAFNNDEYPLAIGGADPNQQLEEIAASLLQEAKFAVVPVGEAREAFKVAKPKIDFWSGKDTTEIQPGLKALAQAGRTDAVLLISTSSVQDPFTATNQFFSGHGYYHRSFLTLKQSMSFVVLSAKLYDATDGRLLGGRNFWASVPVANVGWRKKDDPFTPEELQSIRTSLDGALSQVVSEFLKELGLVK
jgi:hypothetical protein